MGKYQQIALKEVTKVNGGNARWLVSWRWLFLVALTLGLSSTLGSAQSLAEVAKKEKERREKLTTDQRGRVITDRDLQSQGRLPSSLPAAPADQAEGGGQSVAEESPAEDEEGQEQEDETRTQEYWRARVEQARQKIQQLEEQLQSSELSWGGGMRTDVNPVGQKNLSQRQDLERQLAEARAELQAIQVEARRAGVPAGWVR